MKLEKIKAKLASAWRIAKQPSTKKALIVVLGFAGIHPETATAIAGLIDQADTVVQSIGGLVAGSTLIREMFRDEEKK